MLAFQIQWNDQGSTGSMNDFFFSFFFEIIIEIISKVKSQQTDSGKLKKIQVNSLL